MGPFKPGTPGTFIATGGGPRYSSSLRDASAAGV